jgi:lysophospholipase L1-like esterase
MTGPTVDAVDASHIGVRFVHLDKLPVIRRAALDPAALDDLHGRLAGLSVPELVRSRAEYRALVGRSARALLERDGVLAAVEHLPFTGDDVVLALGDSITDDLVSWVEVLAGAVATVRPGATPRFVNAGFTGDTTQEAISRWDTVAAQRPTWILMMLGTNDARRHGASAITTTSGGETRRNLEALRRLVADETDARLVAMTPPPVLDERADAWEPFRAQRITWRDDDVRAVAAAVRDLEVDALVDVHRHLAALPPERWLLPDGVHPSVDGQVDIAEAVVRALAPPSPSPGSGYDSTPQ